MLTKFKGIGKRVLLSGNSLKINAWRAAWILALALGHPVSHGIAIAALPVAMGNTALPSLAPLLKEVTPAVVNISVLSKSALEDNPLFRDPFFRRFFDVPEKREPQVSAGSGVIVDAVKGYVLTNNHVIRNAQQILVTLKDRRQLEAKLIGADPGTDIALLKIEAKNLIAVPIGDSDGLNVGDFVVAIGNPFGLGQTVTSGIVSALGRTGLNIEGYEDFIQTDASINPGNSGGALITLNGELIGINTAIIGPSGGNVGIGFAVPSNMARAVMNQVIKHGEVRRGRLGIEMADLTPELAKKLGVNTLDGALLTVVQPGSPADKVGLKEGDVVTALNGRPIRHASELRARLGLTAIGEEVEMRTLRGNAQRNTRVQIAAPEVSSSEGLAVPQLPGMRVFDIQRGSALFQRLQGGGVVVTTVEQGSSAWNAGFRPGDIIYAVNRRRINTGTELQASLRGAQAYAVSFLRGDFNLTITLR